MKVDTEKLKQISTVALAKGVSTQTVYNWISSGRLDSVKIDKTVFIIANEKESQVERIK